LLEPLALARTAEAAYHAGAAPINSVEGFIRQIIGWREYIYWQYWRSMPEIMEANFWKAIRSLPDWFWDGETEMNCLRHVLSRVREQGYAHHIERLMVLSNFCLLAGLDPLEVNDWFTSSFIDAYEWVMAPNVFGMGLNADGGVIATKPYIASANYINKMSDYCQHCDYDHKKRTGLKACPFNTLYWNFAIQNEEILRANPRLGRNVLGLRYLDEAERQAVVTQAEHFLQR
jgi:deoxyribodipyrimidine photolyase-related protein